MKKKFIIFLSISLFCMGCGQSGKLYLPDQTSATHSQQSNG